MITVKEWRKYRNQASILYALMMEAPEEKKKEAQQIYTEWQKGKITYQEAKKKLERITQTGTNA